MRSQRSFAQPEWIERGVFELLGGAESPPVSGRRSTRHRTSNPCRLVVKNRERARERILTDEELPSDLVRIALLGGGAFLVPGGDGRRWSRTVGRLHPV